MICERGDPDLLHPELFAWSAREERSFSEVSCAIAESRTRAERNISLLGARVDVDGSSSAALACLRRAVSTRHPDQIDRAILLDPLAPEQLAVLASAYALTRDVWPELLREIEEVAPCLYFFDFPTLLSFSGFELHGAIFLRHQALHDPVLLAEELLHEAAHVRLNGTMAATPLVESDEQTHRTPLRSDPRPMLNAFHQLFVLGRIAYFHHRVAARSGREHERAPKKTAQFLDVLALVTKHARLTEAGARIVASLEELAVELEVAA